MAVVNAGQETIRFSTLLRLIIAHSNDAVQQMREVQETAKLPHEGGFLCYRRPNSSYSCDCWYDLEYYDFVQNKSVNIDLFDDVCETLDRGKCKHVVEHEQQGEDGAEVGQYFDTTLTHAAAASGNLPVLEYLAVLSPRFIFSSSHTGIMPLHIAAIKCQHKIYKYIHKSMLNSDGGQDVDFTEITLVKRDTANMTMSRRVVRRSDHFKVIADMLLLFNITDANTIKNMMAMGKSKYDRMAHLVWYFVLNDAIDVALAVISACLLKIKTLSFGFAAEVMVACVLADADDLLENFIAKGFNVKVEAHGYNLLDVARAFGSEKCASMLKQRLTATRNIYKKLSPFNFLLTMANSFQSLDPLIDTKSDGTFLVTKCLNQGFDVNAKDTTFRMPPLHVALSKAEKNIKPLLSIGADVNGKYLNTTALCLAISLPQSECKFPQNAFDINVLKSILFHNPVPERSRNISHKAIMYDLHARVINYVTSSRPIKMLNNKSVGGEADEVLALTTEERFLAISGFALLREFGFLSEAACENVLQELIKDMLEAYNGSACLAVLEYEIFLDYIRNVKSTPRTLRSICRIAIRKTYPGNKLQEYLRKSSYPKLLIDYIVWPSILWQTRKDGFWP